MAKAENGRAFVGQYRIDAEPGSHGMSLRLSLDADILLRLATDTGGGFGQLEVADIAGMRAEPPTLSWRRHGIGITLTLLGLGVALASLVWLTARPRDVRDDARPAPLPSMPEPPPRPSATAPSLPVAPVPAPPVIRLEPTPSPAASALGPPAAGTAAATRKPAATTPPPLPPAVPHTALATRTTTAPTDPLDLFDDTK
jgi:hypothetical protein